MIREFIKGVKIGVYIWYGQILNYKCPLWACWIMGILTIPLNIVIGAIWLIIDRSSLIKELTEDMDTAESEMKDEGLL